MLFCPVSLSSLRLRNLHRQLIANLETREATKKHNSIQQYTNWKRVIRLTLILFYMLVTSKNCTLSIQYFIKRLLIFHFDITFKFVRREQERKDISFIRDVWTLSLLSSANLPHISRVSQFMIPFLSTRFSSPCWVNSKHFTNSFIQRRFLYAILAALFLFSVLSITIQSNTFLDNTGQV